jgi:hypothetical protein
MNTKPQLMTIDVKHFRNGKCIWSAENLPNVWHQEGQEFLLANAFDTDGGIATIPDQYYLGLDDRSTLAEEDTLADLNNEPASNGYARQALSSVTGFAIGLVDSRMTAQSGIATFVATIGPWGPVANAFLTTSIDNSGYLIASVALSSRRTVVSSDAISVRINLSFSSCS